MKDKLALYAEKYNWIVNAVLVVLLAYTTATTVNNFVRSAYAVPRAVTSWRPPIKEPEEGRENFRKDLAVIENRNLFQAKVREEVPVVEEAVQVNLNFCVQGLIVGPMWKFATIKDLTSNQSKVLAEGEEIAPGWILTSIEPEKIIVSTTGGQTQQAEIDFLRQCAPGGAPSPSTPSRPPQYTENPTIAPPPGGEGIQAISETEYLIDRKEFEAQLSNLNELMTQARMVPNFTPDRQVDGFRIFQIRPGSIFQKLGLRNGDVIQRVNGIKLDEPTKGLELFTALKNLSAFTIDLKRNNVNMTMTYTVK